MTMIFFAHIVTIVGDAETLVASFSGLHFRCDWLIYLNPSPQQCSLEFSIQMACIEYPMRSICMWQGNYYYYYQPSKNWYTKRLSPKILCGLASHKKVGPWLYHICPSVGNSTSGSIYNTYMRRADGELSLL